MSLLPSFYRGNIVPCADEKTDTYRGDILMLFSGQGSHGVKEEKAPSSLLLLFWFELGPLGQGKFGISDIRGDLPSPSPTPILRAPWMPRALRAGPAHCLACERRAFTSHPLPSFILTLGCCSLAYVGTWTFVLCSSQDSSGGSVYVYCAKRGEDEGQPQFASSLPHMMCLLQVLVPKPFQSFPLWDLACP